MTAALRDGVPVDVEAPAPLAPSGGSLRDERVCRRMLWSLQTDRGDVDVWIFVRRDGRDPSWCVTVRVECECGDVTLRTVGPTRREHATEWDLQQHVAAMVDRMGVMGVRTIDGHQVIP